MLPPSSKRCASQVCVWGEGGGWLSSASSRADILPQPTPSSPGRGVISGEGVGREGVARTAAGWRGKEMEGEGKMLTWPTQETSLPPSLLRHSPETALSSP